MNPLFYSNIFYDFEELVSHLSMWDISIRQLQPGPLAHRITQFEAETLSIGHGTFSGLTHQVGEAPSGTTLIFHSGKRSEIARRGNNIPANAFMVFRDNSELDANSKGESNNLFSITLPTNIFRALLPIDSGPKNYHNFSHQDLHEVSETAMNHLKLYLGYYIEVVRSNTGILQSQSFRKCLEDDLLCAISRTFLSRDPTSKYAFKDSKTKQWRRIETILERDRHSPILVSELIKGAKVSESTIRRLFYERFGVPPKTYLIYRRLHGVREDLIHANKSAIKVTDVANDWGFWHLGQFAQDYRKLFGELPSDTLKYR